MSNIKKGYALALTTWENDADNYKTETKYGLTEKEIKMYISLIDGYEKYGDPNRYDEGLAESQINIILDTTFSEHDLPEIVTNKTYNSLDGWFYDEFLYEFGIYSDQWLRHVDKIKVFYYPKDVEDVTHKFTE